MFLPSIPRDVDDETYRRIARSFYVVRMVRYALLLVFFVVFLVAVELKGWSSAAAVAVVIALVAVVALMVVTRRRYLSGQRARPSPTSASPTG